uniref:Uncharacterized protein n=1 Tax=Arundo donax TaxID=35708 RepID=A0A0A9CDS8_ARUDO
MLHCLDPLMICDKCNRVMLE